MKNIKIAILLFLALPLFFSCSEETVMFSSEADFASIQVQKFDYGTFSGRGKVYQGIYSPNRDTIYFDITYFPDQERPTYTDWQIQSTLPSGARVSPGLSGVRDMSEAMGVRVTAPDLKTAEDYVVKMRIYEVPFADLEKGFGRYNPIFELTKAQLGGWTGDDQRSCAVVGDYLIVSSMDKPLLVYDKRSGNKVDMDIPMPAGASLYEIYADADGTLLANTGHAFSSSWRPNLKIFRWKDGLDQAPELFYELPLKEIPMTGSHGTGFRATIWGSTAGNAQIMMDIDGRGSPDNRAVRISVEGGVPQPDFDIFNTGIETTWSGTAVAMSATGRTPYVVARFGNPIMNYKGDEGTFPFVTSANNSNFLNKIVGNAQYFEFNNVPYLAVSTISWPGVFRMLIFNLDDPVLITSGKNETEKYELLNPFVEEAAFTTGSDVCDVTVQVQEDGRTALVYFLCANTGIVCYELTNTGTSSE